MFDNKISELKPKTTENSCVFSPRLSKEIDSLRPNKPCKNSGEFGRFS